MAKIITFYDLSSNLETPGTTWSPNTWKTKYSLDFKRIPYKTEWVEYPDVEALCKKIGAAPTGKKPDGSPFYTLPVIHDPSTGAAVSESLRIAEYLDATYPDTPKLFPPGTRPLQFAFLDLYWSTINVVWQFGIPQTNLILNPKSEVYFRKTREVKFGKTMEDLLPKGQAREVEWKKLQETFGKFDGFLQEGKAEGPYLLGSAPCFADFVMAAMVIWLKTIWGENSEEWKDILTWHGGRWAALIARISTA